MLYLTAVIRKRTSHTSLWMSIIEPLTRREWCATERVDNASVYKNIYKNKCVNGYRQIWYKLLLKNHFYGTGMNVNLVNIIRIKLLDFLTGPSHRVALLHQK